MKKKATTAQAKSSNSSPIVRRKGQNRPPPTSSSTEEAGVEIGIPTELSADVGGSEERVLESLLSSITDKLGDQGVGKAQMHEFLNLVLDTDPALKEEILRGIRPTK
jgi:hypothetical protein